mmetsp:Transcript_11483/g.29383  ORF Transcript_11483/g.29383 Transcript_11483/m.29383 type:complete len:228 (+) Transcript_11483:297-980(+)
MVRRLCRLVAQLPQVREARAVVVHSSGGTVALAVGEVKVGDVHSVQEHVTTPETCEIDRHHRGRRHLGPRKCGAVPRATGAVIVPAGPLEVGRRNRSEVRLPEAVGSVRLRVPQCATTIIERPARHCSHCVALPTEFHCCGIRAIIEEKRQLGVGTATIQCHSPCVSQAHLYGTYGYGRVQDRGRVVDNHVVQRCDRRVLRVVDDRVGRQVGRIGIRWRKAGPPNGR